MAAITHPWQNGPTELIEFALANLYGSDDFHQRIAFLVLDIGVETLFKTYLTLPDKTTGTKLAYGERKKASDGSFHELCDGIERAAATRIEGINLSHVEFYHELRNKLYHQGNGITIPTDKARGYAALAVELLSRLLEVDLSDELRKPQIEVAHGSPGKAIEPKQQTSTDRAVLFQQFFSELLEQLKAARPSVTGANWVSSQNYFWFGAGRAGFSYGWWFRREGVLSADLYIDIGDAAANKRHFDKLEKWKDEIEKEIGTELFWERMDQDRQSRVGARIHCRITDPEEQLEKAKVWALDMMLKFIDTFQPRIKAL
jgi:hypothetical protein